MYLIKDTKTEECTAYLFKIQVGAHLVLTKVRKQEVEEIMRWKEAMEIRGP